MTSAFHVPDRAQTGVAGLVEINVVEPSGAPHLHGSIEPLSGGD